MDRVYKDDISDELVRNTPGNASIDVKGASHDTRHTGRLSVRLPILDSHSSSLQCSARSSLVACVHAVWVRDAVGTRVESRRDLDRAQRRGTDATRGEGGVGDDGHARFV